ncbi:MAG: tyrosine-type recombinase/integrase [Defluviicoccus sp.]
MALKPAGRVGPDRAAAASPIAPPPASCVHRLRARAGLRDARIHDLRHTYASAAVAASQGLPMIGKLLGHTQVRTKARYAHLAADPVKAAADQVAAVIAAALG